MSDPLTVEYTAGEILIGRVVHTAICALQAEQGDEMPSPPWDCAPGHIKVTCLEGVRRARTGVTPGQHHDAWCEEKRAQGWTLGDQKDYDAKTHPCLRPYGELPRHQQVKISVFIGIVRVLVAAGVTEAS